jgi:hypothetical protein
MKFLHKLVPFVLVPVMFAAEVGQAQAGKVFTFIIGGTGIQQSSSLPTNHAPVISGIPRTRIVEEQAYWFRPRASDADGDDLTFSIANRPSWAYFNRNNGALRGTPRDGDDGSYNNIVITVSDGSRRTSLRPFNLVVVAKPQPPTTGNVSLSWVAPSTRTDGSVLSMSEIAGYRIYRGTTSGNLQAVLDLNDGYINSYVMQNQESGVYYFAVTAYDNDGNESNLSNIEQKHTM